MPTTSQSSKCQNRQDNIFSEPSIPPSSTTGKSHDKIRNGKNCNFVSEGRPITKACGDDSRAERTVNNEGASMIIGILKLLCRGYLVVALVVALCALIGLSLNHTPSLSRTSFPMRPDAQMPKVLWYCVVKGISWPQAIDNIGFTHQISFMDWLLNRYDPWGGPVLDKIGRGRVRTG